MFKKRFFKILSVIFKNKWVQLGLLVASVAGIFALAGAFASLDAFEKEVLDIVTGGDTLAVFFAAIVSIAVALIISMIRPHVEESNKVKDDHHEVIKMYSAHKRDTRFFRQNYSDKDGVMMYLKNVDTSSKVKVHSNDPYSDDYRKDLIEIDDYKAGKVYLPNLNVFANIEGNVTFEISDSKDVFKLDSFISENASELMNAHSTSKTTNNPTIRLTDFEFDNESNVLKLTTQRTRYFDMLITNRCMDYKINDSFSLRDYFEASDKISSLKDSKFANQIGINGLVFTQDGYLLIEKRGRRKATWKNKFAQPISLALKAKDCVFNEQGIIGSSNEDATKTFEKTILGTLKSNFGLTKDDLEAFEIKKNFMGIARDLLEGGKPNMYFYVVTKYKKDELMNKLRGYIYDAAKGGNYQKQHDDAIKENKDVVYTSMKPALNEDKLDSLWFLLKYEDMLINYDYEMTAHFTENEIFNRRYIINEVNKGASKESLMIKKNKLSSKKMKRECGEALLASLYFANLSKDRILEDLKDGGK